MRSVSRLGARFVVQSTTSTRHSCGSVPRTCISEASLDAAALGSTSRHRLASPSRRLGAVEAPDGVDGIGIAVSGRAREHARLDVEGEEMLVVVRRREVKRRSFHEELPAEDFSHLFVAHQTSSTGEIEGVLVVDTGEGVQREAAVPEEVAAFGRRDDESEQAAVVNLRTDRMDAWTAVGSSRREKREADSELIQERMTRRGEVGPELVELTPGDHSFIVARTRSGVRDSRI